MLSFQNGFHLYYLYRFYFISKPPFRIAKNWIHQFLTRRKQLVFGKLKICHNLARCQSSFYLLDPKWFKVPWDLKIFTYKANVAPCSLQIVAFQSYFWGILEAPSVQAVKSATTEEANFWLSLRGAEEEEEGEEAHARKGRFSKELDFDGVVAASPFYSILHHGFYYVFCSPLNEEALALSITCQSRRSSRFSKELVLRSQIRKHIS